MEISFIVPVYKVEKYIEKCLASIQAQTSQNWQCIVVNDGTPDRSFSLAKEQFQDDARFVFVEKENGGLSDARNFGLTYAEGEYISFVDSDDTIDRHLAEECCHFAKKENCDIVCFDLRYVYEDEREAKISLGGKGEVTSFQEDKTILWWNNSANNKIYRRSFLQGKSFIKGIWYEDLAVIPIWMAEAKKVGYLNKAYYFYLQREGSISHSADPRVFDIYFSLENIRKHIPNMNEKIFAKLVIDNGLVMTNIRIKEMNNKKQRLAFYERHAQELKKVFPQWFSYAWKSEYSWKHKFLFLLFYLEAFSTLEKVSKR